MPFRVAEDGNFPLWHPNGRALVYVAGQENHRSILTVSIDGGAPKPVLPSSASTWEISRLGYSPNGNWITSETQDRQVTTVDNINILFVWLSIWRRRLLISMTR